MSILRSACLSVLCVMGFALPSHAVSFSATAFGDWSGVTLFGPNLGQVVAPIPIGGNPLAALSVSTLTPDTTYTGLISGGLTYDFSAGGVASIDVSLQYNPVLAFGDGHGVLPLLIEQSGNYYGAGLATTGSTVGWNTVSLSGLTTADFQLFDGARYRACRAARISLPGLMR